MAQEFVRPIDLASAEGARLLDLARHRYGNAVVKVIERFARLLVLRSPDADNFILVGAQLAVPIASAMPDGAAMASVGGTGLGIEQAFAACVGEAIELLAGFERPGDIAATGSVSAVRPREDVA